MHLPPFPPLALPDMPAALEAQLATAGTVVSRHRPTRPLDGDERRWAYGADPSQDPDRIWTERGMGHTGAPAGAYAIWVAAIDSVPVSAALDVEVAEGDIGPGPTGQIVAHRDATGTWVVDLDPAGPWHATIVELGACRMPHRPGRDVVRM